MIQEYSDEITYNKLTSIHNFVNDFHLHNFYEFFLLLDGEVNFYVQQTLYHLTPGSLLIINDLEIHKAVNKKETPYTRIYIHIPPAFFNTYQAKDLELTSCFHARKPGERNLIQLTDRQLTYFLSQFTLLADNDKYMLPGKELLRDTYLLQLLVFINNMFRHASSPFISWYTPVVQDIMNYMEKHLSEDISLDSLSLTFSLSKYHLCHMFKQETGTTIFNYLLMLRISKAKAYLCDGKNVTDTCYLSGFKNYSSFITTFKKHTGYTPKKYASLFRR